METRKRLLQPDDEQVTIWRTFPSVEGRTQCVHEKRLSRGRDSVPPASRISQTRRESFVIKRGRGDLTVCPSRSTSRWFAICSIGRAHGPARLLARSRVA